MMRTGVLVLISFLAAGVQLKANQEFERTYKIIPGRAIKINNHMGDINVSGYKGETIKITAKTKGPDSEAIQIIDKSFGPRVELFSICKKFKSRNTSVNFDVKIPETLKTVPIQLETGNGNIEVTDIEGDIFLRSLRGEIKLNNNLGKNIFAYSVGGDIDAKIKQGTERSLLKLHSDSGNVKVTAPSDIKALVDMSTKGTLTTEFPFQRQHPRSRYSGSTARGKLGSGSQKIDLYISSIFGSISLLKK